MLDESELLTNAAACKNEINIATVDSGGYFKIWNIAEMSNEVTRKEVFKETAFIRAQKKEITCVDFAIYEDFTYLVTGSLDKNIHLYSIQG